MYKLDNSHSFMKFAASIKCQSHLTRVMKSTILSIYVGISVKDMFKNIRHVLAKLEAFHLYVIYCMSTCVYTTSKHVNTNKTKSKPLKIIKKLTRVETQLQHH